MWRVIIDKLISIKLHNRSWTYSQSCVLEKYFSTGERFRKFYSQMPPLSCGFTYYAFILFKLRIKRTYIYIYVYRSFYSLMKIKEKHERVRRTKLGREMATPFQQLFISHCLRTGLNFCFRYSQSQRPTWHSSSMTNFSAR